MQGQAKYTSDLLPNGEIDRNNEKKKVALFLGALMTASAKLKLIGPNGSFIARLMNENSYS